MARLAFWSTAVILLALATHLASVLFSPAVSMASTLERIFSIAPVNRMTVLDQEVMGNVVRELNPDLVYAICPYDIGSHPLAIEAHIPDFYWSISVYSAKGDNVYTLNDQQAGVSILRFRLALDQAGFSLEEMVADSEAEEEAAEAEAAKGDDTVVINTPTAQGVILLRAFMPDPAYRGRLTDALAASSCRPAQATS
ncbi:DUF1254 domain-containing protein [Rhodoligotrophos ferricapiens]|uniref:DUF1254 domain-containing protein n=1 Tax=Rhodoligotrophos ferricapiens TaxID=3069264 RepID=UPI00315CBE1A